MPQWFEEGGPVPQKVLSLDLFGYSPVVFSLFFPPNNPCKLKFKFES